MKLALDEAAESWFASLSGATEEFDWDEGNRTKHEKHGVRNEDIEALVGGAVRGFAGRIQEPDHTEPRWLAVGEDREGRKLALIFTRRGDLLRPISCRPVRREERRFYDERKSQPCD